MIPLAASVLNNAGDQLGGFIPRLGGALALLVLGLLLARVIAAVAARALSAANVDSLAERGGVHEALARAGLERSLVALLRRLIRIGLSLVVIFAALSLLGLQFLSDSLNKAVLFLPSALAALALVLTGVVLGGFVRQRVERLSYQMDFPVPLGQLAQIVVFAVFLLMAAAQVAISTAVLVLLLGILISATAVTFTLAFGLGGRELARDLSAARYVRGAYGVGQTISVDGHRGAIVAIESTATLLDAGSGTQLRVPNHLLLQGVVTLHASSEEPGA